MSAKGESASVKTVDAPVEDAEKGKKEKAGEEQPAKAEDQPKPLSLFKNKPCIIFSTLCVVLVSLLAILVGVLTSASEPNFSEDVSEDDMPYLANDLTAAISSCTPPKGSAFKDIIMRAHNIIRGKAALNGSFGADMMAVKWEPDLALEASRWAEYLCTHDHFEVEPEGGRVMKKYGVVGQNVLQGYTTGDATDYAKLAVLAWHREIRHYLQLVWGRSYRIGCSLLYGPMTIIGLPKAWIVCNYAPAVECPNNVFTPSVKVASRCLPGSAKGTSGLCELRDENVFKTSINTTSVTIKSVPHES